MAYELTETGEKKWKGDGNLLKDQLVYQESINKQFEGINSEIYQEMPPSVGWMFIQPCNFRCTYCFAVFDDLHGQYLNKQQNLQLCHLLSQQFQKITFLGGEPTLIPYLKEMLIIAKSYHVTTSIITNGYRLTDENYLKEFIGLLDWITVSIDSSNPEVHAALGRGYGSRKKKSSSSPATASGATAVTTDTGDGNVHGVILASFTSVSVGVKEAWTDIDYRPENFRSRGGYYQWEAETGGGMGAAAVATCGEKDIEDLCQSNRGSSSSKKTHSSSLTKTSRHGPSSSHQASCPRANLSTPMNTSLCISVAAMAMMLFGTFFTSPREW